jgi:hypothetical protein
MIWSKHVRELSTSKRGGKGRKMVLMNEVDGWLVLLMEEGRWERLSIGKNGENKGE